MAKICLVSCVSSKANSKRSARDLYTSTLFRYARAVAERDYDRWFILSAKHALLHPEDQILPYEETLITQNSEQRKRWAERVIKQLRKELKPKDSIAFLAGDTYREFIMPVLAKEGFDCAAPLAGLGIGQQIHTLKLLSQELDRINKINQFYEMISDLRLHQGSVPLAEFAGARNLPNKGIYFFFETSEHRLLYRDHLRCVRIGTHAVSRNSQSTLWTRLRTHRGGADKRGNHRGSIFRLHVGAALLSRGDFPDLTSWGVDQTAPAAVREAEEFLEVKVSEYIGKMHVLWLCVPDEPGPDSDRSFIERNAIALLSGPTGPLDLASRTWLGLYSPTKEIKRSALWNVNYVRDTYHPDFLSVFERYLAGIRDPSKIPSSSIAPEGWRRSKLGQLELL
jgi:hypothetical protein